MTARSTLCVLGHDSERSNTDKGASAVIKIPLGLAVGGGTGKVQRGASWGLETFCSWIWFHM